MFSSFELVAFVRELAMLCMKLFCIYHFPLHLYLLSSRISVHCFT